MNQILSNDPARTDYLLVADTDRGVMLTIMYADVQSSATIRVDREQLAKALA